MAKQSSLVTPLSTNAAALLDTLLAAIGRPAGPSIAVAVNRVEKAYRDRSVSMDIRPTPVVQNELDLARKTRIKAEIADDAGAGREAARRVDELERELSSSAMKLEALDELREERRSAVSIAHDGLGDAVADHRRAIRAAAEALEDEAKRLKAVAWAAQKAVGTDDSLFDPYASTVKSPVEQAAIDETRAAFPETWSRAFATWQRVQSWLCRP